MQLLDVLCYIILTITVTSSCARIDKQNKEVDEPQDGRRIRKREATLIMDLNGHQADKIFQKPKVIYRRISMSRYGVPNIKYGSDQSKYGPLRQKNRPYKAGRKPGKKGRRTGKPKSTSLKYGLPNPKLNTYANKKRVLKNRTKYGVPKYRPNSRPGFGHIVKMPHYSFFAPDKSSFGEPPVHIMSEHQTHKQSYGEPPVDSYGAPLKPSIKDVFTTGHSFQDSTPYDDIDNHKKQEHQWNHKYASSDSSYALTKKEPTYSNFVTPTPIYNHMDSLDPVVIDEKMQDSKFFFRNKRPYYFEDSKVVNRPWKPNKQHEFDDEIIVGGQYAEPPARYVSNIRQNSPMYEDDEDVDTFSARQGYVDTDNALSANNSPYVNYKNSNLAFSPQNLNDAFSIVDK